MQFWIENITIPRMIELCAGMSSDEEVELIPAAQCSDPLIAGLCNGGLLCILGFIPQSTLSDEAYVWMCSTPLVNKHKTIFGRWAFRMLAAAWQRYPRLVGLCEKDTVGWLIHLGAKFGPADGLVPFILEKSSCQ
jgi:hypothetical protein